MHTSFNTIGVHTDYNRTQPLQEATPTLSEVSVVGEPEDKASKEKNAAAHGDVQFSVLSPETINYIIQLQNESGETPTTPEALQARHTELREEYFDRIMTDPDYAAQEARQLSQSIDTILIPNEEFDAYAAAGKLPPGSHDLSSSEMNPAVEMREQRIALYETEVAKGTESLEIIAKLLEFNANISDDYWDKIDPANLNAQGDIGDIAKNRFAEFQYYTTRANQVL